MELFWTEIALQDRADIFSFIHQDNPEAAARLDSLFGLAAARLRDFPYMGRPGLVPGTRELSPHQNYRLVYAVEDSRIFIMALVHVARRWPPLA